MVTPPHPVTVEEGTSTKKRREEKNRQRNVSIQSIPYPSCDLTGMPTTVHSTNSQTRPHLLLLLLLLLLLQGHQLLLTAMLLPHLDIGHLAHVGPLVLGGGPRPHLTVA